MLSVRVPTSDDRGKSVELFDPFRGVTSRESSQDPQYADLVARLFDATYASEGPLLTRPLFIPMVAGIAFGLLVLVAKRNIPGFPDFVGYLLLAAVVGSAVWWSMLQRQRLHSSRIVNTLLSAARCPSCAYSLGEISPSSDGCKVCSECGAAWNAQRIASLKLRGGPTAPTTPRPHGLSAMLHAPISITDARSRLVPLIDPTLGRIPPSMSRDEAAATRKFIRQRTRARRVGLVLALGVWAVLMTMAPLWQLRGAFLPGATTSTLSGALQLLWPVFGLVFPIFILYWIYRVWTAQSRATREGVVGAMLDMKRCPSCGARLEPGLEPGLEPSLEVSRDHTLAIPGANPPDVIECAACSAAWHMPNLNPSLPAPLP